MKILFWILTIFVLAIKRLYAQKGLTSATLLGLIIITALIFSIPLYTDAVYFRVLNEELTQQSATTTKTEMPSPFTFLFRYIGTWHGVVSWEDVKLLDEYLSSPVNSDLGLPRQLLVRYFKTENFFLLPQQDTAYVDIKDPLTSVNFGFISGINDHITILEGEFPVEARTTSDSTVDILISEILASRLGVQVDETYITFTRQEVDGVRRTTQIPVRIAGIWQASDPTHSFWFTPPETLHELLLVPEGTFLNRISDNMEGEIATAVWYLIMDGSNVHASDAGPLLARITAVQQKTSALLPNTSLHISPVNALRRYQQAAAVLTILLYAFSVPILVLILTFINLVLRLSVERRRNEIAVLRSRGASTGQIIGMTLLEGLLLGGIALVIGLPIGMIIAETMGQTQTFLNFSQRSDLRVAVTRPVLYAGLVVIALTLCAQIMPTIGAASHTIVSYKQGQARLMRPPWWQRAGLDIWLFIPAAYGSYLLSQQGTIILPGSDGIVDNTPFQNPLLFLVPALTVFSLTLFFLRILPILMSVMAWITARLGGVGLLLATRQLARVPGFYTAPMILLIVTLSLSAFTASLAQTLDNHLFDQVYYNVGADIHLVDLGQISEGGGTEGAQESDSGASEAARQERLRWLFLPVSEYLNLPGVQAAARIGAYAASTRLSGGHQTGTFIGLDRIDFTKVAFWRWDFASAYLGDLMNFLAIAPDGVLLPRTFMNQHALDIDDIIQVNIDVYNQRVEMQMKIVGSFELFPTWYPEDGPLFVGNLDYFFEQAAGQYPYDVWLKTKPDADYNQITTVARHIGLPILEPDVTSNEIRQEQRKPERQGLFGLLSVGFGAASVLMVLGFIMYTLFSFRQRFIELGILRAIGLSAGQMAIYLIWELAFLILAGLVLGTILGIWSSQLYIPYLQIGTEASAQTPTFLVEIAWLAILRIYIFLGFLFIVALAILTSLLLRMRIFQAVKLGETV